MEEKGEQKGGEAPIQKVTFDFSRKTGKHIRLVLKIPKGGQDERQHQ